jgi:hypothetical protein
LFRENGNLNYLTRRTQGVTQGSGGGLNEVVSSFFLFIGIGDTFFEGAGCGL